MTTKVATNKENETIDWSLGWRHEARRLPGGHIESIRIPLTPEEAKHPQEGYIMPIRTLHDHLCTDLCDMLRAHYAEQAYVAVFHDLVFDWDIPDIGNYAPDVAVVKGVQDRDADRSQFVVALEGVRPSLIIEVVSPKTRETDRLDKVRDYARIGVQEYVYIDHWKRKQRDIWDIAGYRLVNGQYLPLVPDEDSALYLDSINMRIGIEDGKVWLEDANTGENLLNNLEVRRLLKQTLEAKQQAEEAKQQAEEAQRQAEQRAMLEEQARKAAEARLEALEAQLRKANNGS